jgi:hypothetical protein
MGAWLHLQRDVLPWECREEPRAVLSHESAAGFHGLGTIVSGRPTFTALGGTRATAAVDLKLHHMQLRPQDWSWERDESLRLPLTTPARTIVDLLLSGEEPSYVERAMRDAARHRKSNSKTIERRIERLLGDIG